jgi:hypothetical protein
MGTSGLEEFLTFLARKQKVTASTQNQAFSALLFLYREILNIDLQEIHAFRAKKSQKQPVVLSRKETSIYRKDLKYFCYHFFFVYSNSINSRNRNHRRNHTRCRHGPSSPPTLSQYPDSLRRLRQQS